MRGGRTAATLILGLCLCTAHCKRSDGASSQAKDAASPAPVPARTVSFWGSENHDLADAGPERPAELGMRFTSDVPAQITGIRFYKLAGNTGPHVANVWSSDGTLLASVQFKNETASGWQQADLKESVAMEPKAVYVVSYHQGKGHYAFSKDFFNKTLDVPPLHAPMGAGVFAYGTSSTFPQQSFQNANYWIEPVVYTAPLPKSSRTVSLKWKASTTPHVTYNVYRKRSANARYEGPPIASDLKGLTYDDHVVAARGEEFFYIVRAVDQAKIESFDSNEVRVTIPPH